MPDHPDTDEQKNRKRFERRVAKFSERTILGLSTKQIYPPAILMDLAAILPERLPLIDRKTPVASMGSCFAREIRNHLVEHDYNYVQYGEGRVARHGSAPWERVYNTGCIAQEIARAFGAFEPDRMATGDGRIIDPHRKGIAFDNAAIAETQLVTYAGQARSALMDARIFIVTLGLSEVWYNRQNGKIYAEAPPRDAYDASRDDFRLLAPHENTDYLKRAFTLLRQNNPEVEIILTVSPVPLRATFFKRSAIVSNTVSKASVIFAAHEISRQFDFVHYFPGYEITHTLIKEPFDWDLRHVRKEAVKVIMAAFEQTFVHS